MLNHLISGNCQDSFTTKNLSHLSDFSSLVTPFSLKTWKTTLLIFNIVANCILISEFLYSLKHWFIICIIFLDPLDFTVSEEDWSFNQTKILEFFNIVLGVLVFYSYWCVYLRPLFLCSLLYLIKFMFDRFVLYFMIGFFDL